VSSAKSDRLSADVRVQLAGVSGTDPADWHLVSKGRHAMMVAMAQQPAGEVLTQPLTCLTAVAPAISAGHRPTYADIDPGTLAIDPARAAEAVTERTCVVVGQHTFGAAAPMADLRGLLPDGVMLLEDSAHCLGEIARGADGQPVADVSVHSFGLEKMLPTRTGAAIWVNPTAKDRPWYDRLVAALRALDGSGRRQRVADVISPQVRRVGRKLGAPGARAVALAARTGLVEEVIMASERGGDIAGEPSILTGTALAAVARELPGLAASQRHRRRVAAIYREGLAELSGVSRPAALDEPDRTLVRYPILLSSAERAQTCFTSLQDEGLVPGLWYRPLLFPGPTDPAPFAYDPATCPVAEDVSSRILNLPTAPFVTQEMARRAVALVRDHAR
jgi:dTDP-4-amino-4,6-dideoxygalactose transaminase